MIRISFVLIPILLGYSCTPKPPTEVESLHSQAYEAPFTFQWGRMASTLMERMKLQGQEKVILVAMPGEFDSLVVLLQEQIEAAPAQYMGTLSVTDESPEAWNTAYTLGAKGKSRSELIAYMDSIDIGIMLPGATPEDPPYGALQEVLKKGKGRTIHFHWAGAYDMGGLLLENDEEINRHYQSVLFQTDYEALARIQQEFEASMRGKEIQVSTPSGTQISFEIGDRPVTKQDGDASEGRMKEAQNLIDREVELPAGAIRVAPLESTVSGTIAFPRSQWNGEWVEGLKMEFVAGKLVSYTADLGMEAVEVELADAGEAGRSFREFALGLNPLLAIPDSGRKWIPYYGYGAGVVRLSLGDNTELGGEVGGGYVRWNFFPDATVKVGDEFWVKEGKLVK